jgi:hypothetical protein
VLFLFARSMSVQLRRRRSGVLFVQEKGKQAPLLRHTVLNIEVGTSVCAGALLPGEKAATRYQTRVF